MKIRCKFCWENSGEDVQATVVAPQIRDREKGEVEWFPVCRTHFSGWFDDSQVLPHFDLSVDRTTYHIELISGFKDDDSREETEELADKLVLLINDHTPHTAVFHVKRPAAKSTYWVKDTKTYLIEANDQDDAERQFNDPNFDGDWTNHDVEAGFEI